MIWCVRLRRTVTGNVTLGWRVSGWPWVPMNFPFCRNSHGWSIVAASWPQDLPGLLMVISMHVCHCFHSHLLGFCGSCSLWPIHILLSRPMLLPTTYCDCGSLFLWGNDAILVTHNRLNWEYSEVSLIASCQGNFLTSLLHLLNKFPLGVRLLEKFSNKAEILMSWRWLTS